jgi:hypothetical protein
VAFVIVSMVTTNWCVLLLTELVPHAPVPPVVAAVTVKFVEPAGVDAVLLIVRVVVVVPFETVVGLKAAVSPVAGVQLMESGAEVQVPEPVQVVVIKYVALEPTIAGFGVCVPTVTEVIVSEVTVRGEFPLLFA